MGDKNILVRCQQCGKLYYVSETEYRNIFWHGEILRESYCPFCGRVNQEKINFSGSGGGKF